MIHKRNTNYSIFSSIKNGVFIGLGFLFVVGFGVYVFAQNTAVSPGTIRNPGFSPNTGDVKLLLGGGNPIVVHSLSLTVPSLPADDFDLLWAGYSFAGITMDESNGISVNLTDPNSCNPTFRPIPFMQCGDTEDRCDYDTVGDRSAWLSAGMTVNEGAVSGIPNIMSKVGRCAVFMPRRPALIFRDNGAMDSDPLSVPSGWTAVYTGFTLQGLTPIGTEKSATANGGACIQNFAAIPFIQCHSPNACEFITGGDFAAWSSGLTSGEPATTDIALNMSRVGKCALIIKS